MSISKIEALTRLRAALCAADDALRSVDFISTFDAIGSDDFDTFVGDGRPVSIGVVRAAVSVYSKRAAEILQSAQVDPDEIAASALLYLSPEKLRAMADEVEADDSEIPL